MPIPTTARTSRQIAEARPPGGVLAIDLCDLSWGELRRDQRDVALVEDDWVLVTRFSVPQSHRYVREITAFVQDGSGSWQRDDERHDNVLIDTSAVPALLARHGVAAEIRPAFGTETLPEGLVAVVGG